MSTSHVKRRFPTEISLLAASGKISHYFRLGDITAKGSIDPGLFNPKDPGKPWKIERDPIENLPAARAVRPSGRVP
jgi:hypothetical protein